MREGSADARAVAIAAALVLVVLVGGGSAPAADTNNASVPVATPAQAGGALAAPPDTLDDTVSADVVAPESLTLAKIDEQRKTVEDNQGLAVEEKKKVLDLYDQARKFLETAAEWQASSARFEKARAEAPALLEQIKAELAQPQEIKLPEAPSNADQTQLAQQLSQAEAELAAAQKDVTDWDAERKRRAGRRADIPKEAAQAKTDLDAVKTELAAKPPVTDSPAMSEARRMLLNARRISLEKQVDALALEIASYDARNDLITARCDRAARRQLRAEAVVKAWRDIVNEARRKEAERAAREAQQARRAAINAHPAVKQLVDENAQLAERRSGSDGLASTIQRTSDQLADVKKTLDNVSAEYDSARERIKAVGLTRPIAIFLQKRRADLPSLRTHRKNLRARQSLISDTNLAMIEYEEERLTPANFEAAVARIMAHLDPPVPQDQLPDVEAAVREQLTTKKEYLDALVKDYNTYFPLLIDLDDVERQLIAKVGEFARYIDETILWIRNAAAFSPSCGPKLVEATRWLVSPKAWAGLVPSLWADAHAMPTLYGSFALALLLLILRRRKWKSMLDELAGLVRTPRADRMRHTLYALWLTVLLAVPFALVPAFIGWRLSAASEAPDFAKAVTFGLELVAIVAFAIEMTRSVCRENGLGRAHFRWDAEALKAVRRILQGLAVIALPSAFIGAAIDWPGNEAWRDSLGRLVFVLRLLALSACVHILFRPGGRIMNAGADVKQRDWMHLLRFVWYPLAQFVILGLVVMSAIGYSYTAQQLEMRLQATLVLALLTLLLHALLVRWFFVLRRQMAIRKGDERREALAAGGDEKPPPEPMQNIQTLTLQTRRLLRWLSLFVIVVGLWLIWADVLPALGVLERVELWTTSAKVAHTTHAPDGTAFVQSTDQLVAVTVADLLLALLTVVMTMVAARNIPGLLELAVLQRLPLDNGVRFAISTICRYLIVIVGVVLAFHLIGVGWENVQWLIAAMTIGLGFGLQEIFANFVSGLIILFERPMRVGDTVTVGDTTGTVTRIRIRATTITDWDRKELIVPNREFITGRLVNWSLSDTILRMKFPVGIAYGSDTALAEKLLMEIARRHEVVLDDPPPVVVFKGFGESSLDFELRVYIPSIDVFVDVWHALNMAIDAAFREAGIEIAFPQRDLHIRSISDVARLTIQRASETPG